MTQCADYVQHICLNGLLLQKKQVPVFGGPTSTGKLPPLTLRSPNLWARANGDANPVLNRWELKDTEKLQFTPPLNHQARYFFAAPCWV